MSSNPEIIKETAQISDPEVKTFDLKAFIGKIKSDWWIFLISLAVCGILGALFMYYKAPSYNITEQVLIADNDNTSTDLGSSSSMLDLSSLLDLKSNVDNEAIVLQTKHLIDTTVRQMKLNIIYYQRRLLLDKQISTSPIIADLIKPVDSIQTTTFKLYPIDNNTFELAYKQTNPDLSTTSQDYIFHYNQPFFAVGVGLLRVKKSTQFNFAANQTYRFDIEAVEQRVYDLQQIFTVTVPSTTVTTIALVFDYPLSGEGEGILARIVENYRNQDQVWNNMVADSTINFVDRRLVVVNKELMNIEQQLQIYKQKNSLADPLEQGVLLVTNSSTYQDQLTRNETQLNIINSLLDYLNDETKNKTVVPESVLPTDVIFTSLVEKYNELLMDRDKQLLSVTKENPFMQNVDAQIVALRKDMIKNLSTTKKGIEITNQQLKASTAGFTNEINEVPSKQRIIMDLSRQQTIQQTLYEYLLQKKEETEITRTSNLSIATIIDPSKADYKPYSPNIYLVSAVAIFLGLIFPIVRIYILELMNDKILTREDIVKLCSIPIIGEISHSKTKDNIISLDLSRSAIAEQFRALRTNLHFFINKADEKVILLTSSMSGEGKSFVTMNLAAVLALSGKKVLIMELDLRKPKISNYLGLDNSNGFSNYIISSDMSIPSIIVPSNVHENLFLISSGPIPPNPTELILDARADDLFVKLRKDFDYILIDAPPVGLVTDAQLMDRFSDMALYIVRQSFTFKGQLKIADELYKNKKIKKLSIVVNDIVVKAGYGYSYGYGYGYGYGYYQNEEKNNIFTRLKKRLKK